MHNPNVTCDDSVAVIEERKKYINVVRVIESVNGSCHSVHCKNRIYTPDSFPSRRRTGVARRTTLQTIFVVYTHSQIKRTLKTPTLDSTVFKFRYFTDGENGFVKNLLLSCIRNENINIIISFVYGQIEF